MGCFTVQIAKIRDDVDYYISSCCESDFEENDELYEDLKLDEASAALGSRLAAMNHDADDHSSDVSSEAPSIQNSTESISPSPSLLTTHSKVGGVRSDVWWFGVVGRKVQIPPPHGSRPMHRRYRTARSLSHPHPVSSPIPRYSVYISK